MSDLTHDGVERLPLHTFTENAYLNYSMYVIMDRALPYIGDGFEAGTTPHHLRHV